MRRYFSHIAVAICFALIVALFSSLAVAETASPFRATALKINQSNTEQDEDKHYTCPKCNGRKFCQRCLGFGYTNGILSDRTYKCGLCYGSGICYVCGGRGYVTYNPNTGDGENNKSSGSSSGFNSGSSGSSSSNSASSYSGMDDELYIIGSTGDSNVHSGPSLDSNKLGVLHKNEYLPYANQKSYDDRGVAWYKVYWKGGTAWVSSRYTEIYDPSVG